MGRKDKKKNPRRRPKPKTPRKLRAKKESVRQSGEGGGGGEANTTPSETAQASRDAAKTMQVIGHDLRMDLLQIIKARGTLSVMELCQATGGMQPTVSHHLGILRMSGFLVSGRAGKCVMYSLPGPESIGGVAIRQAAAALAALAD